MRGWFGWSSEAQYDLLVITDGDIRVGPDYLRAVAHPFRDPKVGGATTLYVSTEETTFVQELQSIGMISDFFAGILVAWQLDGVKFMFGQSIVTTKQRIAGFGGYETIENRPADDLNVGRLVAAQAEVKLLPYVVKTVADFASLKDLFYKRVRWMTVMRLVRRQGHRGAWAPRRPVRVGRAVGARQAGRDVAVPDTGSRHQGVTSYFWTVRDVVRDRLLRFLFAEEGDERSQIADLVARVEQQLERYAEDIRDFPASVRLPDALGTPTVVHSFDELCELIAGHLEDDTSELARLHRRRARSARSCAGSTAPAFTAGI